MKRLTHFVPHVVMLLMAAISLSACSTFGYEGVDTTRKAILVSTAEIRQANALLQDLIIRDVVTNEQSRRILDSLQKARNSLQSALRIVDTNGDPATAQTRLAQANVTITIAISLLTDFQENAT